LAHALWSVEPPPTGHGSRSVLFTRLELEPIARSYIGVLTHHLIAVNLALRAFRRIGGRTVVGDDGEGKPSVGQAAANKSVPKWLPARASDIGR
jgi:hypothetical protein